MKKRFNDIFDTGVIVANFLAVLVILPTLILS